METGGKIFDLSIYIKYCHLYHISFKCYEYKLGLGMGGDGGIGKLNVFKYLHY